MNRKLWALVIVIGWTVCLFVGGMARADQLQAIEVTVDSSGDGVSQDAYTRVEETIEALKGEGAVVRAARTGLVGREGERSWCVELAADRPVQVERVSRRFGQIRPDRGSISAALNQQCKVP